MLVGTSSSYYSHTGSRSSSGESTVLEVDCGFCSIRKDREINPHQNAGDSSGRERLSWTRRVLLAYAIGIRYGEQCGLENAVLHGGVRQFCSTSCPRPRENPKSLSPELIVMSDVGLGMKVGEQYSLLFDIPLQRRCPGYSSTGFTVDSASDASDAGAFGGFVFSFR